MPSSRQVRSTRTAISPRLAMRTLRNMVGRIVPDLRFGDVRWVDETDSTNTRLLEEARAGAPEGRVLVADDAKLAGPLAESGVEGDAWRAVVVGMGLNVTAAPAEGATALADHAAR